jgi:threonyl-tRNA synthetase
MGLFHQQEEAAGMVFWHPKGWTFWRTLEGYLRRKLEAGGYVEVKTPQLVDRKLWEESGHWEKFRENMYLSENEDGLREFMADPAQRIFALKPMNCPCHVEIFNVGLRSYRELPLRMAEMGSCHRFEPSGALHGILRVRNFTQDDAHIFCSGDQIESETIRFCQLLGSIYKDLGFPDYFVKFSDRPPTRIGSDAIWDQAEGALQSASKAAGVDLILNPGEGAFYGPKLEFVLRDAIGRDWQCGTLQVDFENVPRRCPQDARHVAPRHLRQLRAHDRHSDRELCRPLPAVDDADASGGGHDRQRRRRLCQRGRRSLRAAGVRVDTDLRNEKINYKVREHSLAHVPLIIAVGRRDMEAQTVAIRRLGSEKQEVLELGAAVTTLSNEARPPF